MKMNDDFIYKALPKVRKDFAQSLYVRISADTDRSSRPGMHPVRRIPRRLQVAIILLGVLVLVAWSQIRLWIRYVPIGDLWLVEFSHITQPAANVQTMELIPTPRQLPTAIIDGEVVMLLPGFNYLTPDWIPDGFSPTEIPGPGYSYEESIGMWSNNAQETIRLFVVPRAGGARPYAPPGMYKEVHVNNQPAILVFGRLAPNSPENPHTQRQWDETLGLQLTWSLQDSIYIYTLETLRSYVTEQDLIQMAESMKTVDPPLKTTPWKAIPGKATP
jgi:hypothetical protein